jgi:hypothetical protein
MPAGACGAKTSARQSNSSKTAERSNVRNRSKKGVPRSRAKGHIQAPIHAKLKGTTARELLDLVQSKEAIEEIDDDTIIDDLSDIAERDPRDPYGKRHYKMIIERSGIKPGPFEHDEIAAWLAEDPEFAAEYEAELAARPEPTIEEL